MPIKLRVVYGAIWKATEFMTPRNLVVWPVFDRGCKWIYAVAVKIWHLKRWLSRCANWIKGWPVMRKLVFRNLMTIQDDGLVLLVLKGVDTVIRVRAGLRMWVDWGMLIFLKLLLFFFYVLFYDLSLIMIPLKNVGFWLKIKANLNFFLHFLLDFFYIIVIPWFLVKSND